MGGSNGQSILDADVKPDSPAKPRISRRRVRRACDECRLHKARCDGHQGCETCVRHNRECTYILLPTECKGSAARILILERRLTRAKEHIRNLEPPKASAADLYKIIVPQENLRFPAALSTTMVENTSIAVSTGFGLVEALLSPLSHHRDIRALLDSDATRKILCNSHMTSIVNDGPPPPFCRIPSYDTMLQVAHAAFNNNFGLSGIISERCFHATAQKLYDVDPLAYTVEDALFVPLFSGVMTLGMICQPEMEIGYHSDLTNTLHYFENIVSVANNNRVYFSVPDLQVGLILVLYFVNTSKFDLAHCLLQSITSSSIFDAISGASTATVISFGAQSAHVEPTKDIFWITVYLDMHVSSFLGVATQLPHPKSSVHFINTALRNIAIYKRSDSDFLLSVSLAIAIECLRLIQYMVHDPIASSTEPDGSSSDEVATLTNLRRWTDLEVELGTLESAFRRIFTDDDANPQLSLARNELLMYLRMSQVILHFKHLLLHSQPLAKTSHQHVSDIQKGRACVMAASNAITSISKRMENLQTTTLTWLSAYTIFISTITLLVATIALEDKDVYIQYTIEHTVRVAFQILKHATYGAERLSYISFLLAVSAKTNLQFQAVLQNDVSIASTTGNSSSRSESSRVSSYLDPSTPYTQSAQIWDVYQWRSPGTLYESPGNWGFD